MVLKDNLVFFKINHGVDEKENVGVFEVLKSINSHFSLVGMMVLSLKHL